MIKYLFVLSLGVLACSCTPSRVSVKAAHEWGMASGLPTVYNPKIETTVDWNL